MDLPRNIALHGGTLRFQKTYKGKVYFKQTEFKPTHSGITAAKTEKDLWIEEIKYGASTPKNAVNKNSRTFFQCAELNLKKQLKLGRQITTLRGYQDALSVSWGQLFDIPIDQITRDQLIELDDAIEFNSQRTRKNHLTALRGVFTYAMSRGWIESDPSNALKNGDVKRTDPSPYTNAERDLILAELDSGPFKDYFRIAFGTGARTGELLALLWDDFDGHSLWIGKSIVRGKLQQRTKTDKSRRVVLGEDLASYLSKKPRPIRGGYIITGSQNPITNPKPIVAEFKRAHKAAGVTWKNGPYPWRHTYISSMLSIGVDPFLIAEYVGDRVDTILTYYAKYLPRKDEVAIMNAAWRKLLDG
jgi:integrase